eukprot:15434973-Alexandrium_andersonii.AAC.2
MHCRDAFKRGPWRPVTRVRARRHVGGRLLDARCQLRLLRLRLRIRLASAGAGKGGGALSTAPTAIADHRAAAHEGR